MAHGMDGPRVGVFGGTFDPVHVTHIHIARAAREQARLDRVLFVVSARPPHKRSGPYATPEQRYAMVRLAVDGEDGLEPSRIEIDRDGPSYTVDTLELLTRRMPEARLFLIMGIDALKDLPKWRDPEGILERARVLAVDRPGVGQLPPLLDGHYDLLPFEESPVSSTEIRRRVVNGEALDPLVPPAVADYIRKEKVYHACPVDGIR
jgi:nicotinate-nucleotide adenylyltransferase